MGNKIAMNHVIGTGQGTIGALDFKRHCTEWSVYDVTVPREPFESIGTT